ncbi:hypothetical protein [Agrococcus sp. ARC_14]|uniref:hypothetical protein n=1 Tax=Agrococcus sp. ARC_14 TaxID=2919927 RepID=UPI001F059712|nr:hypothetical protein [Agrococcus sp. ARC_14]MCH1881541.1 hypothetical protein [Agrococcus sp. ARC_14]
MTNPPSSYGEQHTSVPDTQTVRRPHGDPAQQPAAAGTPAPRRIMGIQPVLFVGMCLLAIVSIVTVVLIFIGDFESQAPRVVWTVVVFLAFTGLLALDLVLARRSATPLVIGVAANTYLLAVLMIAIWVRGGRSGGEVDDYDFGSGWLFAELLGIVLLTLLVVRAAAAGSWGLITLGKASGSQFGRVLGLVAAGLLGLVGVLLTLHFAIDAFGIDVGEWYWRSTVAAIVVTALAASVTVLLFWNRRNLDWQEAEARGEHVRPAVQQGAVPAPSAQWPQAAAGSASNPVAQQWPAAPAATQASTQWPAAPAATQWPGQPPQQAAQPDANGLLPWPTHADGTPYPVGHDGQPVFPPNAR